MRGKTGVFQKNKSVVFRNTFSCELFQYFHPTQRRGARPSAPSKKSKIVEILGPKSRVEKNLVPNLHFWAKCFSHFDDLQSNLFFPRSVRIDFSRSVVFNLVQRDLLKEIRFYKKSYKKSYQKVTKIAKTQKSSRNGHPWVEIGRRPYQNDQKSKIYKNPIELLRQNP